MAAVQVTTYRNGTRVLRRVQGVGPIGPPGPQGNPGQSGGGDVSGPASATDGRIAVFAGATGKIIRLGVAPISDLPVATSGTSDAAKIVRSDDSRLSDTRTPTDGSTTTAKMANNAADNTKIADMAQKTWKRGPASGTGDPIDDTTANALSDLTAAGALRSDQTKAISVGYTITPYNLGTLSSGTTTLNPALGNYQYATNNGAFTLAAPTADCAIDILITNGASAGAITFSGFTVGPNTGAALTTTSGNRFIVSIRRINGVSTYLILALQ